MGICFQPWNKIAEYDRPVFVYKFAVVHLAALLNETNLSKRKIKHTVQYLLYISEDILLSLSVDNFFWEFAFILISSFAIRNINSQKNTQALSVKFSIDFASKFAKIEPHKIKEFKKLYKMSSKCKFIPRILFALLGRRRETTALAVVDDRTTTAFAGCLTRISLPVVVV